MLEFTTRMAIEKWESLVKDGAIPEQVSDTQLLFFHPVKGYGIITSYGKVIWEKHEDFTVQKGID